MAASRIPRRAAALSGVAIFAIIGGGIRGAAIDTGSSLTTFSTRDVECSTPAVGTLPRNVRIEAEVVIDVSSAPVELTQMLRVRVPTAWWEVDALRSPDSSATRRAEAAHCLLDSPFDAERLGYSSAGLMTTITLGPERLPLRGDNGRCPFGIPVASITTYEVRLLTKRASPSDQCEGPVVRGSVDGSRFITRVITVGDRQVHVTTPPDSDTNGTFTWAWTAGDGEPDLELVVPISVSEFATSLAVSQASNEIDLPGLHVLRVNTPDLLRTSSSFFALLLVVGALRWSGAIARSAALLFVAAAVLLTVGSTVNWSSATGSSLDYTLPGYVALGLVAAAALPAIPAPAMSASTRGWLQFALTVVTVVIAGLAVSQVLWFSRFDREASIVVLVLGTLNLALVMSVLWAWSDRAIPRTGVLHWEKLGERLWRVSRVALACIVIGAVGFTLGWGIGFAARRSSMFSLMVVTPDSYPRLVFVFAIAALAATTMLAVFERSERRGFDVPVVVATGIVWGVFAGPDDFRFLGLAAPIGAVLMAGLLPLIVIRDSDPEVLRTKVVADRLAEPRVATALLNHGPETTWRRNVRFAAEVGSIVAILPVGYFLWAALDAFPERTRSPSGAGLLGAGVMLEAVRWVATAAIFGFLYNRLRGRNGPTKALWLSGVWFGAAAAVELANRWSGRGTGRVWIFPGLQLFLFLTVVGVLYDYFTVRNAGGSWPDLQVAYRLERTRDFLAAVAPVLIAVLAIAQQIASGTGLDFVRGVIESVPALAPQ